MKLNDAVWGAVLLLLAAAVLVHVQSFGTIPGQKYGPAIFPGLVACGIAICAALLIFDGLKARTEHGGARAVGDACAVDAFAPAPPGLRARDRRQRVLHRRSSRSSDSSRPASSICRRCSRCSGCARAWIVPLAVLLTLAIHTAFYKLLKVPLPWGILQGFIW